VLKYLREALTLFDDDALFVSLLKPTATVSDPKSVKKCN
jgi:hypothetical protein